MKFCEIHLCQTTAIKKRPERVKTCTSPMLSADNSSVKHGGEDSLYCETPARPQVSDSLDCSGDGCVGRGTTT